MNLLVRKFIEIMDSWQIPTSYDKGFSDAAMLSCSLGYGIMHWKPDSIQLAGKSAYFMRVGVATIAPSMKSPIWSIGKLLEGYNDGFE